MFKLGVVTDEISQDFDHALEVALELGLQGVELRTMWDKNVVDLSAGEVERARQAIERAGLAVIGIASPFLKCNLWPRPDTARGDRFLVAERSYEEHQAVLARSLELAGIFNTRLVRTFTFWRVPDVEIAMPEVITRLRKHVAEVERAGYILGLENEHACCVGSGAETARVLSEIKSPALGVIWDPSNTIALGEEPFPDGYDMVKGRVVDVHLKDYSHAAASAGRRPYCAIGSGDIDYAGQLRALMDCGYSGFVTIETHYTIDSDAEAATRQSCAGLMGVLGQVGWRAA
jgi:sugar phosphate isomerase/epimerase